jgi:hypothetical protein
MRFVKGAIALIGVFICLIVLFVIGTLAHVVGRKRGGEP